VGARLTTRSAICSLETTRRDSFAQSVGDERKRVFLKSPVRENRTPGSVRGLLGNWQSYRDGGALMAAERTSSRY